MITAVLLALAGVLPLASGHASIWHPSLFGFNVTDKTFPYDNRPVSPLMDMTFEQWWFHGHLDYPPNPGDIFELPVGKPATTEIACNKGATTWFNSSEGGDIRQGDSPCPNSPPAAYHTTGIDDVKGCALAIAYKSDAKQVQPEDFTVFSVNHTCVWTRFTDFQVPARMPPCPEGGCICGWFWIHSADSGGEQNYMNGFKCNITGSTSDVPLAKSQVARRCGADPDNGKPDAAPGNCTYGAKQPFYWFQKERNNMFEGTYAPPFYLDLYNFKDGAQDDIFVDSYPDGLPPPSPNSTFVPTPNLGGSPSQTQASASATQPSSNETAPNSASTPTASSSVSLSTLSQTSTFLLSSSFSPELPIATSSLTIPTATTSDTASDFAPSATTISDSQSAVVSTSTVVSTVVITVTVSTPTSPPTSAVASTSASGTPSSAVSHSSAAPSTIILNRPSSTSLGGTVPSSGAEGVKVAALNLELSSSSQAAVRPGAVSAAATNAVW
ncbi:hypothetical protein BD413DRAFT_603061 [Trametes elegans]|nr:hypothetical protein BD413DRAFT_603061 [Trametes elegans]